MSLPLECILPRSEINNGSLFEEFSRLLSSPLLSFGRKSKTGKNCNRDGEKTHEFTRAARAKRNGGYLQREEHRAKLVKPTQTGCRFN